jgi:CHAT domain-containing protein
LSSGTTVAYRIFLRVGQYARFQLEQQGNGLWLTLLAPGLRKDIPCTEGFAQSVSLVAEATGEYRLNLTCRLSTGFSTGYFIKWTDLRVPDARDRRRVQADANFAEAEALRLKGDERDSRQALEKYTEAAKVFAAIGAADEEAVARLKSGELRLLLGESGKALSIYDEALALSARLSDPRFRPAALNGLAAVLIVTGDRNRALSYCKNALALATNAGTRREEAQALKNLGDYYGWSSDYRQSSDYYRQSIEIRKEINDVRGQAQAVLTLGYNASESEELDRAVELYDRSHLLFQAVNDRRGLARVAAAMVQLYSKTGRFWEAMDLFVASRNRFESLDEIELAVQMHNNMGYVYFQMGLLDRALSHHQQALLRSQAAQNQALVAITSTLIGYTLAALGDAQGAIAHFQNCVDLFRKGKDARLEAISLSHLGDAYAASGQLTKALSITGEALNLFTVQQDLRGQAFALASLGRVHELNGDKTRAMELYAKALNFNRRIQDKYQEFQTLQSIARLEADLHDWGAARVRIEKAVALSESLRVSVPSSEMRSLFFATTQQCHELYIDILMQTRPKPPSEDLAAKALIANERARARSLLEVIAEAGSSLRQGVDPELLKREQDLQRTLDSKADRRTQLLSSNHTEEQVKAVEKEIRTLDAAYDDLQAEIAVRSPQYASLRQSRPLELGQLQRELLDRDTILLEYSLGERRSYLWLVDKDGLHDYELPPRSKIDAMAASLREHLIARQITKARETAKQRNERVLKSDTACRRESASLSRILLGQAASNLGTKRLVFVPDGSLQYLPLEALPSPARTDDAETESRASRPLIADHEVVVLPSASVLHLLRQQLTGRRLPAKSVAVFADPVFEEQSEYQPDVGGGRARAGETAGLPGLREGFKLGRLLSTRREAEAIVAVVPPGTAMLATRYYASRDRAVSPELRDYRVIHFATHGFVDAANPRLSCIVLSTVDERGRHRNGFLRLLDIYNLNLAADLVVLSACDTALGKSVRGEGLIGMVRGFMYAGVPRVISSLWKVDDESTAELMKTFYREMFSCGKTPAAALRTAQVEMSKTERWSAPYYWAGFVLQGEYR